MKNILVIDDDSEVRSLVALVLENFGFSVRKAASGEQAIEMVLADKPHLIVSDVHMPGMGGHHFLCALREVQATAPIPVILMTGSGRREDFRRAMVCGADDFIDKPFSADELIEAVLSRLARQTDVQMHAYEHARKMRESTCDAASFDSETMGLFDMLAHARNYVCA